MPVDGLQKVSIGIFSVGILNMPIMHAINACKVSKLQCLRGIPQDW